MVQLWLQKWTYVQAKMQLSRARIKNFRSLRDVSVDFGAHTAFIGGNGAGKSSILKAIERFYSTAKGLDPDDYFGRNQDESVEIELTFANLTAEEVETFHSRVRDNRLTVTRIFDGTNGSGRYFGSVLRNPDFGAIRAISAAVPRRSAYNELRAQAKYADLAAAANAPQVDEGMIQWENSHPDQLELGADDGQFFGFQNASRGALQRFTSFVFVPAVRDASADAADAKASAIGRLLEIIVRSSILQRRDIVQFKEEVNAKYRELTSPDNMPELGELAGRLTSDLRELYGDATVGLAWKDSVDMPVPLPNADVTLSDDGFGGPVDRQGHGLQRAFIFTLLQQLARASVDVEAAPGPDDEAGAAEPPRQALAPSLILAIEEPELYQHPTKQRHFSEVLRGLSNGTLPGADGRTQVAFASHSPMFVSIPNVHEIRFVRRVGCEGYDFKQCELKALDLALIAAKLETALQKPLGSFNAASLAPRPHILGPELAEGFFADAVVLVEGRSDKAALTAVAAQKGLSFERAGKVTFASHQNAVPILRDLTIDNKSDVSIDDLTVEITADPAFLTPKTWPIDRISPGGSAQIADRDVDLNAGLLLETRESLAGVARIVVRCAGDVLAELRTPIELLAHNEWGGAAAMPELLAAFVTPNDPAIDEVLKGASNVLRRAGKPDAINGYESKSRSRVWELASAVWSAVAGLQLTYALPPASFETSGQKVRSPSAILEGGLATCLDTALLTAAALEQAGLNPILLLTRGHAFVGLWLQPQEFAQLITDDVTAVRKRIALNELVVFETTLATQKPAPAFSRAVEEGVRQLGADREQDFILALDIRRARMQRLRPLGLQVKGPNPVATPTILADSLEEAPRLPDFDVDPDEIKPTTPAGRLDQWQRKLLDLTVRNRLLHTRPNATTLRLICPDPAKLEDNLADGAKIRIVAQPPLEGLEGAGRDGELHYSRTGEMLLDRYAEEALARNEVLSPLDTKTLDTSLVELYRKARLDLQEGGANTLFLAMGFLNWKRSADDPKTYRAPLILLPVALERKSALSGVRMAAHEDEPRFNLTLLELLRQDFELTIPELDGPLPADDSGIDVSAVWTLVRRAVRDIPGFEVIEELALGTFSFAKYLMWKDLVDRTDALRANAVVRHLMDTPREPFRTDAEFPSAEALDETLAPGDLFAPLPADSSQLTAVVASARGCDFVLDGPPGTGKSQTIANIIAHNLAIGRKVLFVAEKMAALDVVYRRLEERGLGAFCLELHSNKANKIGVINQLGRAWDSRDAITDEEWREQAEKLKRVRDELNVIVRLLHRRHENGLSLHEAIGRTVRDADVRTPALSWPADRLHDVRQVERMREVARRLDINFDAIGGLDGKIFGPIATVEWSNAWQAEILAATTALNRAVEIATSARAMLLRGLNIADAPASRADLAALDHLGSAVVACHGLDLTFAFAPNATVIIDAAARALVHLQAYRTLEHALSTSYPSEACRHVPVAALQARWVKANAAVWPFSVFQRGGVAKALMRNAGVAAMPDPAADLPRLAEMQRELERLNELAGPASACSAWTGLSTDEHRLQGCLRAAQQLRECSARLAPSSETLSRLRQGLRAIVLDGNDLLAEAMPISQAARAYHSAHETLLGALEAFCAAARCEQPLDDADLLGWLKQMCAELVARYPTLKAWCDWRRVRGEACDLDLKPLVDALEAQTLTAGDVAEQFDIAYAKWWAGGRIDAEPLLRGFVPAEHADKIQVFQKLDDHLAELSARYIRTKLSGAIPAKGDVKRESGYGVLRHELTKRMRRKPVRQLAAEMGPALTTLTPCLLMSSLSIAQYLPADAALFDLVIFDEASQITTWDAIGAIARGKQVIIAGDPKQMPPTSFFARGPASSGENDEDVEEDLESILEECLGASIPRHRLTWHYRSKHESLIAFSNHRYYEGELITFPAPVTKETAVTLQAVTGVYAKGKARTNQVEAEAMVAETMRRLADPAFGGLGKSLAIVTLNAEQQKLVEDLLDKERQKRPALETFFSDERREPVVVKNLETVQGDERDLILLGIGYGPDVAGAPTMSMNFGPLNRSGGWRRLNVAITRAREEMMMFASFPPEMIDLNRTSAEAVRDLRHFLEFAARGPRALVQAIQGSVGGFESFFEQAVARGLQEKGWTVVPQIGVSRFRIDLGVVDPDRPGDYLVGVECDGASYHSAATARDRDKVRARILGGLGWRLVRVWSTDWWVDPAGALSRLDAKIRTELDARRATEAAEAAEPPPLVEAPAFLEVLDTITPVSAAQAPAAQMVFARQLQTPPSGEAVYRQADLAGHPGIDPAQFYEPSYTPVLRDLVAQVMAAEAPLRVEALVNRVARAHGFQQSGRLIRERVMAIVKRTYALNADSDGVSFIWLDAGSEQGWRGYRLPAGEDDVRWIDEIPMTELRALGRTLNGGDLAVEVARRFGVRRVSAAARARIEAACAFRDGEPAR